MKRYKYQALVTLYPGSEDALHGKLDSSPHRMVLRGRNAESGRKEFFPVLVSCDDQEPFRPSSPRVLVTVWVVGDDVTDYLGIGEHFDLWLGSNVGEGVITRRVFV